MSIHRRRPQDGPVASGGGNDDGGGGTSLLPSAPPVTGPGSLTDTNILPSGSTTLLDTSIIPSLPPGSSLPPPSSQLPLTSSLIPSLPITPSSLIPSTSQGTSSSSSSILPSSTTTSLPVTTTSTPVLTTTDLPVLDSSTVTPTEPSTTVTTTLANGSVVVTVVPTSLFSSTSEPNHMSPRQIGVIVGTTTAGILLLLIILGLIFLHRRNRLRKIWAEISARSGKGRRERKGLLDDEDFDDDNGDSGTRMYRDFRPQHSRDTSTASSRMGTRPGIAGIPPSASTATSLTTMTTNSFYPPHPTTSYNPSHHYPLLTPSLTTLPPASPSLTPTRHSPSPSSSSPSRSLSPHPTPTIASHSIAPSLSPSLTPSLLFRARASESGSIFREEGVWPPPGERSELVDPFVGHVRKVSEEVSIDGELGRSVLGIMGPPEREVELSSQIGSSTAGSRDVTKTALDDRGNSATTRTSGFGTDLGNLTPASSSSTMQTSNLSSNPRMAPVPASISPLGFIDLNDDLDDPTSTFEKPTLSSSPSTPRPTQAPTPTPGTNVPLKSILKNGSSSAFNATPGRIVSRSPPPMFTDVDINVTPKTSPNANDTRNAPSRGNTTSTTSTRTNTMRSDTSDSMYSTSTAPDVEREFGFISTGSTPAPPVPSIPPQQPKEPYRAIRPPSPIVTSMPESTTQSGSGGGSGVSGLSSASSPPLPPGAAPSVIPGSRGVYSKSTNSSSTTTGVSGYSYPSQPPPPPPKTTTMPAAEYTKFTAPTLFTSSLASSSQSVPPQLGNLGFDEDERDDWAMINEFGSNLNSSGVGGGTGVSVKIPSSQPKKSSPLARTLSSDAKILMMTGTGNVNGNAEK